MSFLVAIILPIALIVVGIVVPLHVLSWLRERRRRGRRSPLTSKLLRGPGSTLTAEIDKTWEDIGAHAAAMLMFPMLVFSIHLALSYIGGEPETAFRIVLSVFVGVFGVVYLSWRLVKLGKARYQLQCGLEAETAVAQELDQLMRQGAIVFHDFPAEEFNIDHVVITRGGVFAVETKSRLKPDRGGGAEDAKVTLESDALRFPDWLEKSMLEQARWQAKWLSRWLSTAVGAQVEAKPVLALPGWYVDRKSKCDVRVISGREAKSLLSGWRGESLSEEMVRRIAHQVEQRCRDVGPTRYRRAKKMGQVHRDG